MNDYSEWNGLRINVFRDASRPDLSNGGASAEHHRLCVVGIKFKGHAPIPVPKAAQLYPASDDAPAVFLVESNVPGYGPHLEPVEAPEGALGPMMGGNYAGASDSRWAELGEQFRLGGRLSAVPVHDRYESPAQYRALSMD